MTSFFYRGRRTLNGSARRGCVITRDDRIRYNTLEKQAVVAARLRFFSITSSSLTGEEAAELIIGAMPIIERLARQHAKSGFIATISRGPAVKIIELGAE